MSKQTLNRDQVVFLSDTLKWTYQYWEEGREGYTMRLRNRHHNKKDSNYTITAH